MNFEELEYYLNHMKMQHIYQPVMIKTLLESKNSATAEKIAKAFLERDTSEIDYYKDITKNMPGTVLRKHKVVDYQEGNFILNIFINSKFLVDQIYQIFPGLVAHRLVAIFMTCSWVRLLLGLSIRYQVPLLTQLAWLLPII